MSWLVCRLYCFFCLRVHQRNFFLFLKGSFHSSTGSVISTSKIWLLYSTVSPGSEIANNFSFMVTGSFLISVFFSSKITGGGVGFFFLLPFLFRFLVIYNFLSFLLIRVLSVLEKRMFFHYAERV